MSSPKNAPIFFRSRISSGGKFCPDRKGPKAYEFFFAGINQNDVCFLQ